MSPERRPFALNPKPDLRTLRPAPVNASPKLVWQGEACADPKYPEGVVLLDLSHNILALDEGATTILTDVAPSDGQRAPQLPREALDFLESAKVAGSVRKVRCSVGNRTYICRFHVTQSCVGEAPNQIVVMHMARDITIADALSQIGAEYRLTPRETQTLEGILLGLSSKEVAYRMGITPNTVKAFLRMVMGKMGVTSRAGIVTKLFNPNENGQP